MGVTRVPLVQNHQGAKHKITPGSALLNKMKLQAWSLCLTPAPCHLSHRKLPWVPMRFWHVQANISASWFQVLMFPFPWLNCRTALSWGSVASEENTPVTTLAGEGRSCAACCRLHCPQSLVVARQGVTFKTIRCRLSARDTGLALWNKGSGEC